MRQAVSVSMHVPANTHVHKRSLIFTLSTFGRPWEKALRSLRRHHLSVHSSRDIRTRHTFLVHAERDSGLGSSPCTPWYRDPMNTPRPWCRSHTFDPLPL